MHRMRQLLLVMLTLSASLLLGLALAGCQDGPGFRTISTELSGPYLGTFYGDDAATQTRQLLYEQNGIFLGSISRNGAASFTVTTILGVFRVSGGVRENGEINLSGIVNNVRYDFTGVWEVAPGGFGGASGSWTSTSGDTGGWAILQQGLSVAGAPGNYTGNLSLDTGNIQGTMSFAIDAEGAIAGTAIVEGTNVVLTGALRRDGAVYIAGAIEGLPDTPMLFYGGLESDTLTMERGALLYDDEEIGDWEAEKAP